MPPVFRFRFGTFKVAKVRCVLLPQRTSGSCVKLVELSSALLHNHHGLNATNDHWGIYVVSFDLASNASAIVEIKEMLCDV